jgi:hypothetical protein
MVEYLINKRKQGLSWLLNVPTLQSFTVAFFRREELCGATTYTILYYTTLLLSYSIIQFNLTELRQLGLQCLGAAGLVG